MKKLIIIIVALVSSQMYSQGWTELPSFPSSQLNVVEMVDSNTIYVGGWNQFLFKTTDGGATWSQSVPEMLISDIDFPSKNTGYIVGDSVRKTTDGGLTWSTLLNATPSFNFFIKVQFIDTLNGYILTLDNVLLKTTDGGNTFSQSSLPVNVSHCDMHFFNIDTGLVLDTSVMLSMN